ncbi:MAG TPA: pilus assembly protein TadG-related protein [Frankiaceae bacterium]|nr:pilus assembly protein TadG-related protein [Frankiaceae bacterium]
MTLLPALPALTPDEDREEGSILVLTLGYAVVLLALVLVVVDASAVFLARRSLAGACDGASLSAAQSVDTGRVYTSGVAGSALPLAGVQSAVNRYRAETYPAGQLAGSVRGGDTVVVTGRRTVDLPIIRWLGIGSVTISANAEASARQLTGG